MGMSDQTPTIQGGTDSTEIGNVGDKLKTAIHDGSGNSLSSTGGSLNVNITGGAGSGGTAQADKSTFTEGTTQFTPTGGVYNETISSDPTEDQAAAARITAKRAIHTNLRNNSGTEIATASNPVRIDPTGSTAQPVTDNGGSLTVDGSVSITGTPNVNVTNAAGASAVNIQDGGNSITVDGTVAATQSGTWNINNISGTVSLPTGASTSANQTTANSSLSSIDTKLTTTNSSLASIDAGIPAALGQTTMSASMPVAIASNQTAIPVTDNGGSLTVDGTVAATQSGTWVLGANSGVDVGDVTINNAAGASAVNIQDGGNSITVDGTVTSNQGTANTNTNAWPIKISDGTNIAALSLIDGQYYLNVNPYADKKTFTVGAFATAIGNNKSMLSLQNLTGSTVIIKLRQIQIKNVQTTATAGVAAEFRLFRFTTHSAGTTITPLTYDTADTLDVNVTARTGATIVGEAASYLNRWLWSSDEWGPGTLDTEASEHAFQNVLPHYKFSLDHTKPITIRANEGIHIKQVTNSTNGTFDIIFTFTQE